MLFRESRSQQLQDYHKKGWCHIPGWWSANYNLQFHLGIQKCVGNIYEWIYIVLSKIVIGENLRIKIYDKYRR